MTRYLVRLNDEFISENRTEEYNPDPIVGIFQAKDTKDLYCLIDEEMDPGQCEYLILPHRLSKWVNDEGEWQSFTLDDCFLIDMFEELQPKT